MQIAAQMFQIAEVKIETTSKVLTTFRSRKLIRFSFFSNLRPEVNNFILSLI